MRPPGGGGGRTALSMPASEKSMDRTGPRILVVTPEVAFLPAGMGSGSGAVSARSGVLADISAALIGALNDTGADVHVAVPNYRNIFRRRFGPGSDGQPIPRIGAMPPERVHLAQDRAFFYPAALSPVPGPETVKVSLAFQREVINRIIPEVRPDLVHCHDWMTGLIPAMTRELGIPCLYTLCSLNTARLPLSDIEDCGIDAAMFWRNCYYTRMPGGYEETRATNPVDILASAVFAAHFVDAPSPRFLSELVEQKCPWADPVLSGELAHKRRAGCLTAVSHAPDPSFNPAVDGALFRRYRAHDHSVAKPFNKLHLQERLGLDMDSRAPLFFWPTRLDGDRPGCRLAAEAIGPLLERYRPEGIQLVFIADGDFHTPLKEAADRCGAARRVAVCRFDPGLHRLAYAAADFVLHPLLVDPSGLPCRIAQRYGALPIGYDTGGFHDAVVHLNVAAESGSGFAFRYFDAAGLTWAVQEAMAFLALGPAARARQVQRIMADAMALGDARDTAHRYIDIYGRLLNRPMTHLKSPREPIETERSRSAA